MSKRKIKKKDKSKKKKTERIQLMSFLRLQTFYNLKLCLPLFGYIVFFPREHQEKKSYWVGETKLSVGIIV